MSLFDDIDDVLGRGTRRRTMLIPDPDRRERRRRWWEAWRWGFVWACVLAWSVFAAGVLGGWIVVNL